MPKQSKAQREKLSKIRAAYKQAVEADQTNRRKAIEDMKFVHEPGSQWDEVTKRERGDRPSYEFNKLRVTIKRVVNDMRVNRPQGKVLAVEDGDRATARIYEGLIRNVCNQSDFDTTIDLAAEYQVGGGMGAWRIKTQYAGDDAFDQDIVIESIRNPFCLYADPTAEDPMCRDARYWFITTRLPKDDFEKRYGKAEKIDWDGGEEFEDDTEWEDDESVRVVEYWYREPVSKTIVLLSDGRIVNSDELDGADPSLQVVRERQVQSYKIRNCIASGERILEEGEWAGSQFPFVKVHGEYMILDGKAVWFGLPRFAKDAQRAYNFSRTYAVEAIALAPQAKFWATPEMAQGHELQWAEAHKKNFPYMLANPDPVMGGRFPEAMPGANIPSAIINEIAISSDDIKGVTGIFDASLGNRSNETSGIAIRNRQQQGEIAVFNYADNMGKAIRRTWEILVDLIPHIYDTQRSMRIIGEDGSEDYIEVNAPSPTGQTINDLGHGKYDVNVVVGPSFADQRQIASEFYMGLINSDPQMLQVVGDLAFKSVDVPYSDQAAERMRVMLAPPVQNLLSEGKALPPEAQAAMAQATQAMQMVEQVGQQLQQEQQKLMGEKAGVEADKAELKTEVNRLQAERQVLDARFRELSAQLENAALKAQMKQQDQEGEIEKEELSVQLKDALADLQKQAAEFMQQAIAVITEAQARSQPQVVFAPPKAKRFVAERDEAGNLVGGMIQEM